ncbi:DUF4283 domain-containing protein [Cephalotus follicularis]|uniref:DUF4283 domain-containing protein n=1 Tax=Cephalotus follicularis TaxID=3775 RepID=A0A1Q3DFG1_CEPFO|nr:DUF4283 domain-containing protein [Cephalotus follicularis]
MGDSFGEVLCGEADPIQISAGRFNKKWENTGKFSIYTAENGIYIFKCESSIVRDWILENGPWDVRGVHLAVRLWEREMPPLQCSFTKVPIWVKLMNILMEYWTLAGLSQMASVLGNPFHMDAATESKRKINFARICVEMSASSKFLINIRTKRNSGAFMDVKVEYCWKPVVCEQCKVFDHSTCLCPVDRKLALSPASVKRSVLAAKANAPNVWVKVGNRGKVNMPHEGENASTHLSSVPAEAGSSKAPAMVDKRKGRVEESPQTDFLDRNSMEINNLEGFVGENFDSLVTKSPGESEAGGGKKKKRKNTPVGRAGKTGRKR